MITFSTSIVKKKNQSAKNTKLNTQSNSTLLQLVEGCILGCLIGCTINYFIYLIVQYQRSKKNILTLPPGFKNLTQQIDELKSEIKIEKIQRGKDKIELQRETQRIKEALAELRTRNYRFRRVAQDDSTDTSSHRNFS